MVKAFADCCRNHRQKCKPRHAGDCIDVDKARKGKVFGAV